MSNPYPDESNLRKADGTYNPNPRGATKAVWAKRRSNAEKSELIVEHLTNAVEAKLREAQSDDERIALLQPHVLKLVHDSLDRYYGKAQSSVDVTSSDGSASLPTRIMLIGPEDEADSDDS